jgi:adenylate cyclase
VLKGPPNSTRPVLVEGGEELEDRPPRDADDQRERPSESNIDRAMADAEQNGLGFHLRVRLAVLAVVAVSLVAYYAPARSIPGLVVVATFAAFGLAQYVLGRRYGRPVFWAGLFSSLEAALLIAIILTPITFPPNWPPQMQLRLPTVFYLFVYVAGTALSYSPRFVVWTGAVTIALWGLGHWVMLCLPGTVAIHASAIDLPGLSPTASLELYLDPHYVSDAAWRTQTVLLALLTVVLAAAVARSRSLLRRQVTDHLARASLARYFSPNVVDALASAGVAGMAARRQSVAVLFADIRGFTRLSESRGTEATIEMLTEFHERVTRIVFDHRGTLEKYIGDAVMATFGTPAPGVDDAGRALRCAWQLADETHRWSRERTRRGRAPVHLGIGVHYGEAVSGSIGDAQRLDYVVVGDTVNVASRLERLTRELDVELVVSDAVLGRIREEGSLVGLRLDQLELGGEAHLTGRMQPITIWTAGRDLTGRSA